MGAFINGFDNQELDKSALWPKAFELIEDGEKNVLKFRENGGHTCLYKSDEVFSAWLKSTRWR
jgi:hypothetical protein